MFTEKFLEQEYKDCAEGIIDPREFYKMFYFYLKFFRVLDGPIPKYTYIAKVIMLSCSLIAMVLLSLSFYHGLETFDIPFLTEAGMYIIVLSYKLLTHCCMTLYVSDYHGMQRIMREDFLFICSKNAKYRKRFFQHHIITRKIYKYSVIFCISSTTLMNCFSCFVLLYHILTHAPGEGTRPLLFPFWYLETDFTKTPIYEIVFTFSNVTVAAYGFNYSFMLGTQILWMRLICCKADIAIWQIEDILDGIQPTDNKRQSEAIDNLIRQRMREIVQQHNSMDVLITQFARVFKKLLMFEQILAAPVVCLSAYAASVKLDEGEFHAILILVLVAAVILIFIPRYLCTNLSLKVSSIAYACMNVPFWNASPVIRPYLVLIMQKSLLPLPLKVPGFEEFSVQTFSNKMASAYSYFNMLRQTNKK